MEGGLRGCGASGSGIDGHSQARHARRQSGMLQCRRAAGWFRPPRAGSCKMNVKARCRSRSMRAFGIDLCSETAGIRRLLWLVWPASAVILEELESGTKQRKKPPDAIHVFHTMMTRPWRRSKGAACGKTTGCLLERAAVLICEEIIGALATGQRANWPIACGIVRSATGDASRAGVRSPVLRNASEGVIVHVSCDAVIIRSDQRPGGGEAIPRRRGNGGVERATRTVVQRRMRPGRKREMTVWSEALGHVGFWRWSYSRWLASGGCESKTELQPVQRSSAGRRRVCLEKDRDGPWWMEDGMEERAQTVMVGLARAGSSRLTVSADS